MTLSFPPQVQAAKPPKQTRSGLTKGWLAQPFEPGAWGPERVKTPTPKVKKLR